MPIPVNQQPVVQPKRLLLRDVAREKIRDAILDGTLKAGELLNDDELQRWLGVSRTPIREALNELARVGLIEMEPNRFTRVALRASDEEALASLNTLGVLYSGVTDIALARMSKTQAADVAKDFDTAAQELKGEDSEPFRLALVAAFDRLGELSENPALVKLLKETVDGLAYRVKVAHLLDVVDRAELKSAIKDFAAALRKRDRDGTRAAADLIFQMPTVA